MYAKTFYIKRGDKSILTRPKKKKHRMWGPMFFGVCVWFLTFAELRCSSCAFKPVFFTFFDARIAGDESCWFENFAIFGIHFEQSSCDAKSNSSGLSDQAATVDVDIDVKCVLVCRKDEGLLYVETREGRGDVIHELSVVDDEVPFSRAQNDARNSGFSSTGAAIHN